MDIKIEGLSREILEEALQQAKSGRMHILRFYVGNDSMNHVRHYQLLHRKF